VRGNRLRLALPLFLVLTLLAAADPAQAAFGFQPGAAGFSVLAEEEDGTPADLAGSHPFRIVTSLNFELAGPAPAPPAVQFTDGDVRDIELDLPPGLIEDPAAVPRCSQLDFHTARQSPFGPSLSGENCPPASQIGTVALRTSFGGGATYTFGLFNLAPPPGFPSQIGFSPFGTPVTITPHIRETGSEYGLTLDLRDFPQQLDTYGLTITTWGTPWSGAHDGERGNCLNEAEPWFPNARCSVGLERLTTRQAYLTLPGSCSEPLTFRIAASSWQQPGTVRAVSAGAEPLRECGGLPFEPAPRTALDTERASSPSGFSFTLQGSSAGLLDPEGRAGSQTKRALVALPEGMTVNPSVGAGLGVCTPAQYAAETVSSPPGAGCPNASRIGEMTVRSPLFEGLIEGGLFLAQPDDPRSPGAENPFGSQIALYLVAKVPERGVLVKIAGEVRADRASGRLTAVFDGLPQLPYADFNVHFRESQRSPLATPEGCGTYATRVELAPWLEPASPRSYTSSFVLRAGIGGGACPAGLPPFRPGAVEGTRNRQAGAYTPLFLHLTRGDGEQEITSYSAQLPPGLLGKLKGIPYCPEAAIEEAKRNSGFAEARDPSCPAASSIGRTVSGYGLGSVLAYAPGGLYLAGPYHGSSFSIVAIDSATVGPFDLGVIIVRSAIEVDPRTAQVSIDSSGSDPIPHILDGFPLHLRDIRVYLDRPGFTVNPTSCERFAATSTLSGSGPSFASPADDTSASVTSPFQVFNCSALGFEPRMSFSLKGGHRRGGYPSLRAVVRPRPGDGNIGFAAVALPPSIFLAQEHIGTICTRARFAARSCPKESLYGTARAVTPLLGRPLEGPVYLRSSDNKLPDLVADLSGEGVRIEVGGRIDSVGGGMRANFEVLPDAPVTRFTMTLRGGRHGLLVNSDNLCAAPIFARAKMASQANRGIVLRPRIAVACGRKHSKRGRKR
jgi:hypothetical protein